MTMIDLFKGYKGPALEMLKKFKIRVWSDSGIKTTRGDFRGIVLPRSENDDDRHIVLKLATGYNIGIDVANVLDSEEFGYKEAHYKIPEKEFPFSKDKKNVKLLGTGGTIASRLDYRTGAVPELADICNLTTEKLFAVFSENMGPEQYKGLAKAIGAEIRKGIDGIVIGHGTDTMHHTAGILSFMVQNSPVPIVMVGSQRSSDRPSSDAALNLMHATKTAAESACSGRLRTNTGCCTAAPGCARCIPPTAPLSAPSATFPSPWSTATRSRRCARTTSAGAVTAMWTFFLFSRRKWG
jgi:glutamyl-tRNA(Gln) amidotransferase subunit D